MKLTSVSRTTGNKSDTDGKAGSTTETGGRFTPHNAGQFQSRTEESAVSNGVVGNAIAASVALVGAMVTGVELQRETEGVVEVTSATPSDAHRLYVVPPLQAKFVKDTATPTDVGEPPIVLHAATRVVPPITESVSVGVV